MCTVLDYYFSTVFINSVVAISNRLYIYNCLFFVAHLCVLCVKTSLQKYGTIVNIQNNTPNPKAPHNI